jgi:hypothetical protein
MWFGVVYRTTQPVSIASDVTAFATALQMTAAWCDPLRPCSDVTASRTPLRPTSLRLVLRRWRGFVWDLTVQHGSDPDLLSLIHVLYLPVYGA